MHVDDAIENIEIYIYNRNIWAKNCNHLEKNALISEVFEKLFSSKCLLKNWRLLPSKIWSEKHSSYSPDSSACSCSAK